MLPSGFTMCEVPPWTVCDQCGRSSAPGVVTGLHAANRPHLLGDDNPHRGDHGGCSVTRREPTARGCASRTPSDGPVTGHCALSLRRVWPVLRHVEVSWPGRSARREDRSGWAGCLSLCSGRRSRHVPRRGVRRRWPTGSAAAHVLLSLTGTRSGPWSARSARTPPSWWPAGSRRHRGRRRVPGLGHLPQRRAAGPRPGRARDWRTRVPTWP